jgi:thiamine transport system permease protein
VLGADRGRAFREVTLPLLLPAVGAAALLIFIFSFSSFGVVLLLGGPSFATVEVEIYRQTAQFLRLDVAAALSLIQILATLLLTLLYTRLQSRGAVPLELRARAANVRPARTPRERWLVGGNVAVIALLIGAPLLALALRSVTGVDGTFTLAYYRLLDENRTGSAFFVPPLIAVRNSLLFALAAMCLALAVGVPAAYLLARRPTTGNRRPANDRRPTTNDQRRRDYSSLVTRHSSRNRFFNSQFSILNSLLDPLFMLPLGTSAVTLGLGYVLAFGRPPLKLIGSPLLIPAAHALLAFPFVVRSLLPALRGLDPRLREAARMLGASPSRLLREVDLPLLFPALLVGAVFAFTVSLGEFGATLLIYPPDYPTVPVVIARLLGQPGVANYGQALALSTILMLVTGASFVLLEQVRYRDVGEF